MVDTLIVSENLTLDLGNYTITGANKDGAAISVAAGTTLNIYAAQGGVTGGSGANCKAISVDGTLNVYGGNYTVGLDADGNGNSTIYANANTAVINIYGGTFSSAGAWHDFYYVLNQWNSATESKITVYGGTFEKYSPEVGDDRLGGDFVAEGYSVQQDGDNYTVVKND